MSSDQDPAASAPRSSRYNNKKVRRQGTENALLDVQEALLAERALRCELLADHASLAGLVAYQEDLAHLLISQRQQLQ